MRINYSNRMNNLSLFNNFTIEIAIGINLIQMDLLCLQCNLCEALIFAIEVHANKWKLTRFNYFTFSGKLLENVILNFTLDAN